MTCRYCGLGEGSPCSTCGYTENGKGLLLAFALGAAIAAMFLLI